LFSGPTHSNDIAKSRTSKVLFISRDQNYFVWSAIVFGVGWHDHLIFQPTFDFRETLQNAYIELQKTAQDSNTLIWPAGCFTADLYTQFFATVTKVITALPDDQVLVRSIRRKVAGYY
jgi:hypothetical protein